MARRPSSRNPLRSSSSCPPVGGHVRILDEHVEAPSVGFSLESGDFVGVGDGVESVLLSMDDIDNTMSSRSGEVGMPTVALTAMEAILLGEEIVRRGRAVVRLPGGR